MPTEMKFRRLTTLTAGLAAGLGAIALAGYFLHVDVLRGGLAGVRPVSPYSALCFLLCGVSMLVLHSVQERLYRNLSLLLAGAVFALSASALVERSLGLDYGISRMIFPPAPGLFPPGPRVPLNTALPFALTSLALIALYRPRRNLVNLTNWLGFGGINFALLSAFGLLFRPDASFDRMAVSSIIGFLLLGTGLICSRVEMRLGHLFSREHPLGILALSLVATGLVMPLLLYAVEIIWLLPLVPELHDVVVLMAIIISVFILGAFAFTLGRMEAIDRRRREAEGTRDALLARLQQQAAGLEVQVAERTRRLEESTQRLQLALRSSGYGVWDRDMTSLRQIWDDRQHALYGLKPGEFDGTYETWLSFIHPDDVARLQLLEQQMLESKDDSYDYEFRIIRRDGAVRHLEAHRFVQRDAKGRIVRVVGMNRDVTTEREHESTLSALHERLQFVLNASGYGVWEMDYTTNRVFWDDHRLEIYGLQREDLRGGIKDWHDRVHPEDLPVLWAEQDEILRSKQNQLTQFFRIIRPDGAIRHIETRSYVLRDADGTPQRLIGFDHDNTQAAELREELRITEERWKLALSSSHDGVWDWNIATGEVFRDARYAEIVGCRPDEMPPARHVWQTLGHKDDVAAVNAALASHLDGTTPLYQCEYRLRHKAGHWVWVLDRGKVVDRDTGGRPRRMVGTQTDVTPRKQLEERLRHGEEMSLQLSRLAQIGAWEWEIATNLLTWSPEMFRIHEVALGYEPTLAQALEFYPLHAQSTMSEALQNAVRAGTGFDLELPFTTARGHKLWVRVLGRADMKDGRAARIYGAFQDITGRRDAEEMRRQLEGQLFQAQKMETLGTLAGGIAHDFNNLLTGILGYQDLALETLNEGDPARNYLSTAREASLRARELVDQILTFSRQAGSDKVPVNLVQVVEDARRFLRATVPATISIDVEVAPGCNRVLADATQIHQVLLNLGSNAAHAMRTTGGAMRIHLAPVEIAEAQASALNNINPGRYVKLDFKDSGQGMDEETRKRIFDPFFTTKEVGQGTGLGLSVVHGIIEAHRGTITVDSAPGKGATFTLYLPEAETNAVEAEPVDHTFPRGGGELVAIVDDEDIVRTFAQMALEKIGYRVASFDSPATCLEAMRRNGADYSLLLTDQTMPVMKGLELAAEVRSFAPQLPVLIMSGYFSRISPDKLAQIGHVALLSKPFTNEELARAIHRSIHPEKRSSATPFKDEKRSSATPFKEH